MEHEWSRIPAPISDEGDRRAIVSVLSSHGLEVRIVRERATAKGSYRRFVEYREQEERA